MVDSPLPPPLSSRRWWIVLLVLTAAAGWLRLSGYNFSLPYIDHPDEPAFYLTGLEWRGVFDNQTYLTGYPPLYIWTNILAQWTLEPFGSRTVAATIPALRLLSIVFNLLTLIVIGLTARRAAGDLAGWTAAAAWAFAPVVITFGVYATPDPLLYLLVALAVWLAVEASAGRKFWCLWSAAAGALAILDKYYILTAVVPGMLVAAALARKNLRLGLRYLAVQGLMLLVTGVIAIVGAAVLPREGAIARESGLSNVLNLERVANNIYHAVTPLQPVAFGLFVIAGVVAYLLARREQLPRVRLDAVLFCLIILISIPWLAASFSLVSTTERMKDVLPATTSACVLLGIAVGQLALIVPARFGAAARYAVALPLLLVFVPQINEDFRLIENRQLPDNRVALRQWADINLEPGTVLVDQVNHKTFNPFWGGIEGRQWFDWWIADSFFDKTPEGWREAHGISYAVIGAGDRESLQTTGAGQAAGARILHLRDFNAPSRSSTFSVYRLWRMQHETQYRFGDGIHLLGYDQSGRAVVPGESLTFRFYWQADAPPADNYSLFIHLLAESGDAPLAQADGAPARPERPTLTWSDPGETLISQPFALAIPADTPAGDYRVMIGLYNFQTGQRLSVTDPTRSGDPGEAVLLTRIEVGG